MSTKVKPIEVVMFNSFNHIPIESVKDSNFITACEWAKTLYPHLYTNNPKGGVVLGIDWEPTPDPDIDIVNELALTEHNQELRVAGPANCVAVVVSYIKNNKGLVSASPSVYNALNNYLVSVF